MNASRQRQPCGAAIFRLFIAALSLLAAGCATIGPDWPRPSSHALAHPERTALGGAFAEQFAAHPDQSGFHVLHAGQEAVLARAALADAAERTLDLQYYIVQNDPTTALLLQHIVGAAQRGVRVRVLLDGFHGPNRDFALSASAADHRIELRLFNPFLRRSQRGLSRLFELIGDGERLNQRMHIKLWITDNAAAIFGGRNLGDEYFDSKTETNFKDLDLLAVGPLVPELSRAFDDYWNSDWAVPLAAFLDVERGPEDALRISSALDTRLAAAANTEIGRGLAAEDFLRKLTSAGLPFVWAPSYASYDRPGAPAVAESHLDHVGPQARATLAAAQSEVILISPYFVPSAQGLRFVAEARSRGVRVAVLTNSLASTDVPVVHAGYARYRAGLLRKGVELFEMRPQANASHAWRLHRWTRSSSSSLHAKVAIVDRATAFVGSMNLDPRSRMHNTELLVVVDSAELAARLAALFDEATEPDHAFRVLLRDPHRSGDALVWITEEDDSEVRYDSEPLTTFWKRLWSGILSIIVPEHQL